MNTDQTTQETQHADLCQPKPISPIGLAAPCIRHLAQVNRLVGERVIEARRLAGIKQVALADKLGITSGHLTKLENGQDSLKAWQIRRIATICKVTTDFLLGHSEESELGERSDTVRELLIQMGIASEEVRAKDVVENIRIQYALASIKALFDQHASVVQELEDAMERVEAANEWANMRGGLRLASAVEECCLKARQIIHRLKGVARGGSLEANPESPNLLCRTPYLGLTAGNPDNMGKKAGDYV